MATAFSYRTKVDTSDSDSDDEKECFNWKRATKNEDDDLEKIPIAPKIETSSILTSNSTLKKKRNNIWCEVLQDQIMSETLNHCGIKNKPKNYGDRGEESYDYTLKKRAHGQDDNTSDENMSDNSQGSGFHARKRFKSDKFVEVDADSAVAAKKIIRVLAEEKGYLIYRIVKYIGIEKAMKLLKMTEEIEESGGIMVKNQQRRRTPGGVYLHLLRTDTTIEKEIMDKIFEGEQNSFEKKRFFAEMRKKKKKKNSAKQGHKTKNDMEVETMPEENQNALVKNSASDMEKDVLPVEVDNGKIPDNLEDGEVE